MDLAQRERLLTQTQIMQDPRQVRGILWLVISLPTIALVALFAIAQEFHHLWHAWPWRNAIEATAVVSRHDVVNLNKDAGRAEFVDGRVETRIYLPRFEHTIDYSYSAGSESISMTMTGESRDKSAVYIGEDKFEFATGSRLRVYYQPRNAQKHQILVDPRGEFW